MRFLLVTHIFPPATDGGSKIIAKVGEYLEKLGNQTLAVTTNHYTTDDFINPHSRVLEDQSSRVLRLPIYHLHRRLPKPIFKFIPFIKTLVSIIKFKPDWIIAGPFPTTIPLYALFIKFLSRALAFQPTRVLIIPCFHQFDPEFSQKHLLFCLKHTDLVCTLTQHESLILHTKYHIPDTRLYLMHAGIDKQLLISSVPAYQQSRAQLVFLGNFSAHKRVELLVMAFSKLEHQSTRALSLVLAGQSTLYWPQIQKVIDSQPDNVKKNITVHLGNYSTNDLEHFLTPGSILVLPSIHESFGLVFIESLARGIPVIGADIPPVKELLSLTGGGLTFKKDDLNNLVLQINRLLSDPKLYSQLSKSGHNYVKNHFTWDTMVDSLWEKLKS